MWKPYLDGNMLIAFSQNFTNIFTGACTPVIYCS